MRKRIAIIISVVIIIAIMVVGMIFLAKDEPEVNQDSIKFKEEYELLNGKYDSVNDITLISVDIDKDNPIKYISNDEIVDRLTVGSGIIYFGDPEDGYSRRAVPILLEFAKKNAVETIYYYNVSSLIKGYENNDEKMVNLYNSIINIIGDYIDIVNLDDESVGIKKISVPDVYFIKNGSIVAHQYKLGETYKDYRNELTEEEKEELLNLYKSNYEKTQLNICTESC